jgi:hypothetical protein
VSKRGIEVDKAKIEIIEQPHPSWTSKESVASYVIRVLSAVYQRLFTNR